ncbi:transglycosylase SLT domain-containing protein [Streptomyces sp. 5-10]|nr:transglycosylase SLT domain-containing protein [Streptomyces sp. 5-10]
MLGSVGALVYKNQGPDTAPASSSIPETNAASSGKHVCPKGPEAASDEQINSWIRQTLTVMKQNEIPGSFDGIKRNLIRESGCKVRAINLTDINAKNGVPSKGLLQVIPPTFEANHVPGTSKDIYDPVANLAAACNYAAHRYGSIDNVNGAY